jgi:hypothetical protein
MKKMKLLTFFSSIIPVTFLVACSSMTGDDYDSFDSSYPSDFKESEYAEVNPDIILDQIAMKVVSYNDSVKLAGLKRDSVLEATLDSAFMEKIYTSFRPSTFRDRNKYPPTGVPKWPGFEGFLQDSLLADTVMFLADTNTFMKFMQISGYSGEWDSFNEMLADELPANLNVPNGIKIKPQIDAVLRFKALDVSPADNMKLFDKFKASIDLDLVRMQYAYYGQMEGRAYRYCNDNDSKDEVQESKPSEVQAKDCGQIEMPIMTQATVFVGPPQKLGTPAVNYCYFTVDFRPNTFCKDKASGDVYLIKK